MASISTTSTFLARFRRGDVHGHFSMATGAYLSHKSHRKVIDKEVSRVRDAIAYAPEEERDELRRIYLAKGFADDEAEILVRRITADPQRWLETLVAEKLGLGLRRGPSPALDSIFTGGGFAVGAAIPLIPFLAADGLGALVAAGILSLLALFSMGAAKALVTARSALRSGVEMVVIGACAAVVTNIVGRLLGSYAAG
jgi:VIT1/CCC1 family predicted Fe2+/Mn2+ transporter